MTKISVPIVVSSCDAYHDVWPVFFEFLFSHLQETPKIFLLSNKLKYSDSRVTTICVGEDLGWGKNTTKALESITEPYFIYLQDDYLFQEHVDVNRLNEYIHQFIKLEGKYLSLKHCKELGQLIEGTEFRSISKESFDSWVSDLQAAVWSKKMLKEIAAHGLDVWKSESEIRKLRHTNIEGFYYFKEDVDPPIKYIEGIKGKFWMPKAVEFCKIHNVKLDLKVRPCPPQGKDMFSKLIRSYYKKRMKWLWALKNH